MSRAETRWRLVSRALLTAPLRGAGKPASPERILIAHQLLLGDTLMLAALFAALRQRYPDARIVTTCVPAFLPLFGARPWEVQAVGYDVRKPQTLIDVREALAASPDLALLPGDNRHALLARACGAKWIVGLENDRPGWKNALCDELMPWPSAPLGLADIFAGLAGTEPKPYRRGDWPAPPRPSAAELPNGRYALLHLGAGNPLRRWPAERWAGLAERLERHGLPPVLSAGPGEEDLVAAVDPHGRRPSFAGTLDLAGLWHLVAGAAAVVCPDSGVAHLAKLTARPTVCLFGQGSDVLFGRGLFFRDMPFAALIEKDIPCRDQRLLFGRELEWVRRCARQPSACADPVCIKALAVDDVFGLLQRFPGLFD